MNWRKCLGWLGGVAGFLVVYAGIAYAYWCFASGFPREDAATIGDMFAVFNALVSGLALLGVIAAVFFQKRELELQREELALTRQELARTAEAQEKSHQALVNAVHAQAHKAAVDILQQEDIREARRYVLTRITDPGCAPGNHDERKAAEKVCHTYDSVGQMVKYGMLPLSFIVDNWGDSLRRTWRILKPLVNRYRCERNAPEFWDDYEYLAVEAFRRSGESPPE